MTLSSKFPRLPAIVMVVWFPMTRAHTIMSASDRTGFTFPGMMDEPGWRAGRRIRERHPAAVVALGGWPCAPTAIAALFARLPLLLHPGVPANVAG